MNKTDDLYHTGGTKLENLAKVRKEKGFTIRNLALWSGVSQTTIVNIEQGYKEPLVGTALAIARALGVTVEELAGKRKEPAHQAGSLDADHGL